MWTAEDTEHLLEKKQNMVDSFLAKSLRNKEADVLVGLPQ